MKIAENLKKYRKIKNITQIQLAEAIGTTQGTITQFECGRKIPSLALAFAIADVFGITVDELCRGVINNYE